jgi:hypothetical protein
VLISHGVTQTSVLCDAHPDSIAVW